MDIKDFVGLTHKEQLQEIRNIVFKDVEDTARDVAIHMVVAERNDEDKEKFLARVEEIYTETFAAWRNKSVDECIDDMIMRVLGGDEDE